MKIVSMYKDYFQKSRVFLYPALGIKRGVSVTPIQTYMSWTNKYSPADGKLCCLYHLRNDLDFRNFEQVKLLSNKYFHEFVQVEEKKGVYVFDYSDLINDWNHIIAGRYSKISPEYKKHIRNFIGLNSPNLPYIDSFLYPDRYFNLYSELMGVDVTVLKSVGELCSLPDLDKENLEIQVSNLEVVKENP
jgi:hypothetical protein